MQASIETTGNLERRLSFSLPEDRLQGHISGRLGEIARTARIKGFRPGKVPAKVIEQRFGPQVRADHIARCRGDAHGGGHDKGRPVQQQLRQADKHVLTALAEQDHGHLLLRFPAVMLTTAGLESEHRFH